MTTAQFLYALHTTLNGDALREAESLASEIPDAPQLAAELVRRNRLTQEQADRLLRTNAGHITADGPMRTYAANFRDSDEGERDVQRPSSGGGVVLLIVALVALVVCLPMAGLLGIGLLGFGAFFVAHDEAAKIQMIEVQVAREELQPAVAVEQEKQPFAQRFDGNKFRLSLDGTHLLHGAGGKLAVSELDSGKKLIDLPPGRIPIGFTRDVPLEVASGGTGAVMPVILNDGVTGQEMKLCPAVRGPITRTRMLPDGDMALFLRGPDLILYNFAAVKEPGVLLTLPEEPTDLAISADGHFFLTGFDSGKVQLRPLLKEGKTVEYPGAIFSITCVALSPNGKQVLAGCEQSVLLWDRANPDKRIAIDHDDAVLCAAFSPDSQRILSAGKDGALRLSNAASGDLIAQFQHGDEVTEVAIHPDGRRAISAGKDKTIRVWNLPK